MYQRVESSLTRIKYGTGEVQGFMSRDALCLETLNLTCVSDFKMLSVVQTSGLEGLSSDGIIGLAPSSQKTKASLFVDEMYNAGKIDKRIFSFKINSIESGK